MERLMRPKKNKYHNNAKISERKTREIFKYFSMDLTAEMTSKLTGTSRVTVNKYFFKIRKRLFEETMKERYIKGIIEVDECYKGPRRVKGRQGRGAGGKIKVFGILCSEEVKSTRRLFQTVAGRYYKTSSKQR
jgi:transposase